MIEVETKLKRWGRSFGIIVPMEAVKEAGLDENEELAVMITKKNSPFLENFGVLKGRMRKPTKQMLRELRSESWDE